MTNRMYRVKLWATGPGSGDRSFLVHEGDFEAQSAYLAARKCVDEHWEPRLETAGCSPSWSSIAVEFLSEQDSEADGDDYDWKADDREAEREARAQEPYYSVGRPECDPRFVPPWSNDDN